jgi:ABC-type multidrug transport system fused ATPase/permease subunit
MHFLWISQVQVFIEIGRWLIMVHIGASMSRQMHNTLLRRVLNAPVSLYFDVTPLGKLTKYFTSNIGRLDRAFFWHIQWVGDTLAGFIVKIAFACYLCPQISAVVAVNAFFLYCLTDRISQGKQEANRVHSKAGNKKSTFMQESYDGLTIIRAFEKQASFSQKNLRSY